MYRGYAVGIDLGTTNSVVAHGTVANAAVLTDGDGHRTLPSVVSFTDDGALVGREARNRAVQRPERTVRSIKREMGRDVTVDVGGEAYTPEQISALVLRRLKHRAEEALAGPVTNAVITVPAYFGHHQRAATRRAGEIAGFEVDRIINEPTAASLAYGIGTAGEGTAETVLVYDLGGGTFDVSLVEVTDGVFDVIATGGDTQLGGDDWDDRIAEWLRARVEEETGADPSQDPVALARLRRAAKRARHDLTERPETTVSLPFIGDGNLEVAFTRERMDELTGDLVDRTLDICRTVVDEVDWNAWTLDEVLLVGGATRMPQVRETVYDFFGQVPSDAVDPDEVVATGAAIQAAVLNDAGDAPTEPVPAGGVGAETTGGESSTDDGTGGDSDAAAGTRGTTDGGPVLVDVVPRSLGIETAIDGEDGQFSPVIERNASIPTRRTERFRTVRDDQTQVKVRVFQGESELVEDNEFLDSFELGVPPAPAGEARVSVTFAVDEDGVLDVTAAEHQTGRAADLTIESAFDARDDDRVRELRQGLPDLRA